MLCGVKVDGRTVLQFQLGSGLQRLVDSDVPRASSFQLPSSRCRRTSTSSISRAHLRYSTVPPPPGPPPPIIRLQRLPSAPPPARLIRLVVIL